MATVAVDVREVAEMAQRYAGLVPVMEREMRTAMVRSTTMVQNDARVAVVVDTGRLRASITTDVTPYVGRVGTNLLYGRVVEEGRRAGAPMPPQGALLEWMRRHGIDARQEYAIRLRISRRGITARPYLIPALEKNRAGITTEFSLAMGRVLSELGRGT